MCFIFHDRIAWRVWGHWQKSILKFQVPNYFKISFPSKDLMSEDHSIRQILQLIIRKINVYYMRTMVGKYIADCQAQEASSVRFMTTASYGSTSLAVACANLIVLWPCSTKWRSGISSDRILSRSRPIYLTLCISSLALYVLIKTWCSYLLASPHFSYGWG